MDQICPNLSIFVPKLSQLTRMGHFWPKHSHRLHKNTSFRHKLFSKPFHNEIFVIKRNFSQTAVKIRLSVLFLFISSSFCVWKCLLLIIKIFHLMVSFLTIIMFVLKIYETFFNKNKRFSTLFNIFDSYPFWTAESIKINFLKPVKNIFGSNSKLGRVLQCDKTLANLGLYNNSDPKVDTF